jgi:peptide/nickel transport system substrate-binding protein
MHRRLWLLAGVAAAVVAVIATGSATAKVATSAGAANAASLHAAPFAQAWAHVPRTTAGRKAKSVLVFGGEQDPSGFNILQAEQSSFWAQVEGVTPVIRGVYIIDQNGNYHLDLASKVVGNKSGLTITLRPDANWNWGGKKVPVTAQDLVYTWQQLVSPNNQVASNTGFINIGGYKIKNSKTVTFTWRSSCPAGTEAAGTCAVGPFADYRDLFTAPVYPSKALAGLDWNTLWANCVCGSDGKPISDGPFILTNWTKGQGVTLKSNPMWYGTKPGLKEIDFKLLTDTNTEIQAMRGGEVDAIFPSPQTALSQLVNAPGLTYKVTRAYIMEHLDLQQGPQGNPLLKQPWMRQAIMKAISRVSLIKAIYGSYAPGEKPLNSLEYILGPNAKPVFDKWSTAQGQAVKLLAQHCSGGPSKPTRGNSAVWTCNGQKAEFRWFTTVGNQRRATSEAIFAQQLGAVGIKIDPTFMPGPSVLFGKVLPSHDYDIAEYAFVFGTPDPSGNDAVYKTGGGQNYTTYANPKVDALIKAAGIDFNPTTRVQKYQQVDSILANDLPVIPLYASPSILVYKNSVKGMESSNNPLSEGPTWNAEQWHW